MAAAPDVEVVAFPLASPELALVDAHLAAELRRCLPAVGDSWPRPRLKSMEAPAAEEAAPHEYVVDGGLSVDEFQQAEHPDSAEHTGVEETPPEGPEMRSWYPVLPAPEPGAEPTDDTDAALRRIRERLVDGDASSAEPRRSRAEL